MFCCWFFQTFSSAIHSGCTHCHPSVTVKFSFFLSLASSSSSSSSDMTAAAVAAAAWWKLLLTSTSSFSLFLSTATSWFATPALAAYPSGSLTGSPSWQYATKNQVVVEVVVHLPGCCCCCSTMLHIELSRSVAMHHNWQGEVALPGKEQKERTTTEKEREFCKHWWMLYRLKQCLYWQKVVCVL